MMNTRKFQQLVRGYYGYKINILYEYELTVEGLLYNFFRLTYSINDDGTFQATLEIGHEGALERFLGKTYSTGSDVESIKESLQIIDDYCRMRLPDKFLDKHYQVYFWGIKINGEVTLDDALSIADGMKNFWGFKVRRMSISSERTTITCMLYNSFRLICKVRKMSVSSKQTEIVCVLYNSFQLACDVHGEGTFSPSLKLEETDESIELFGEVPLIKNNEASIREFCQTVDDYCRKHLYDEFIDAYEESYRSQSYVSDLSLAQQPPNIYDVRELYDIVKAFFGYRAHKISLDIEKRQVECILYDSFVFSCNLNDRYSSFSAFLKSGKKGRVVELLGDRHLLDNTAEAIKDHLRIVDNYCQQCLPDKFLDAYKKAYASR